jgi:DNA-binding NarL/FixJ family response regulator
MSGHVEQDVIRAANNAEHAFLRKSFTPEQLLRAVRRVLDGTELSPR